MRESTLLGIVIAGALVVAALPLAYAMQGSWAPWMTGTVVVAGALALVVLAAAPSVMAWRGTFPARRDHTRELYHGDPLLHWRAEHARTKAEREAFALEQERLLALPSPSSQRLGRWIAPDMDSADLDEVTDG